MKGFNDASSLFFAHEGIETRKWKLKKNDGGFWEMESVLKIISALGGSIVHVLLCIPPLLDFVLYCPILQTASYPAM